MSQKDIQQYYNQISTKGAMKALKVHQLNKTYESDSLSSKKTALIDFSLEVDKGSIFGLLGPNGAGKSTLINILAGLVRKTSGNAEIAGVDIDEDPKLAKTKIGVVPQEINVDNFFSLYDSLEFYAGYFGIRPNNRKTMEILSALGLEDKAHATPRVLSGGMKRRFLVAKAMIHSPEVLILDEPTAGVDIELRDQLWNYVLKLNKQGTTVIITTHYLEEAEKLCDHIGFIKDGRLTKCDTKANLLDSISEKKIRVVVSSEIKKIPEILSKYSIEILAKNVFMVQYNKKHTHLGSILNDISSSGLEIVDLSIHEGSLENLFRQMYHHKDS